MASTKIEVEHNITHDIKKVYKDEVMIRKIKGVKNGFSIGIQNGTEGKDIVIRVDSSNCSKEVVKRSDISIEAIGGNVFIVRAPEKVIWTKFPKNVTILVSEFYDTTKAIESNTNKKKVQSKDIRIFRGMYKEEFYIEAPEGISSIRLSSLDSGNHRDWTIKSKGSNSFDIKVGRKFRKATRLPKTIILINGKYTDPIVLYSGDHRY